MSVKLSNKPRIKYLHLRSRAKYRALKAKAQMNLSKPHLMKAALTQKTILFKLQARLQNEISSRR